MQIYYYYFLSFSILEIAYFIFITLVSNYINVIFCVLPLSLLLTKITARWKLIRQISMLTHETQIVVNPKMKTNETITYLIIIKNGNSAQISDSKCSKLWKQTNECVLRDCSFMKARLLSPAGHFAFIVNIFPRERKCLFLLGKGEI